MQLLRLIHKNIKFCLILLIVVIHVNIDASESSGLKRYIQYSFSLQNTNNVYLPEAELWAYAPVSKTSSQKSLNIHSRLPYQITSDRLGNQIIHFTFKNIPPFGTKIITIQAHLRMYSLPESISSEHLEIFLKHEQYIESKSKEIVNLANKLRLTEKKQTVENIFKWVSLNLDNSGYMRNDRGALWALNNRKGDCTEFMYLFVALCRANDIPARGIGGYVYDKNSILHPVDYHNWAEFYVDGVWRIADPQKQNFMENYSHYIAMRIISASSENTMGTYHKFRFSGEGLKVYMN